MTPSRRPSTAIIVVVALASILVIAVLEVLVIAPRSVPTVAIALTTPSPTSAVLAITTVPTVTHLSSPVLPQPTVSATPLMGSNVSTGVPMAVQPEIPLSIHGPLVDPHLSLLAGPVNVPLEILIPALNITAPVLGVGLTLTNAMASPIGMFPDDPIWQTVFWYRGGTIPGDVGTATFAGHVDDSLGRPAVFAHLDKIQSGDLIVVHDTHSGLDVPFIVTETQTYSDKQAADPSVLARIFGSETVSGGGTQPASDGLSHLTLITCAGAWLDGSFDLRLVVYATRASYPSL